MQLKEFVAVFNGNYTEDQKRNYSIMYGEDKGQWPETDDTARVTIDLEKVLGFNEVDEDGMPNRTNVYIQTGRSFVINTSYDEFKTIMNNL